MHFERLPFTQFKALTGVSSDNKHIDTMSMYFSHNDNTILVPTGILKVLFDFDPSHNKLKCNDP